MKKKLMVSALVLGTMLVGCAPTDAELQEQGWVKNPENNGWVQNPADNGWVQDPENNGWVQNPADNGWVQDPENNGWVQNPADNGWVLDPENNGWVQNPADNGWVQNPEITPSPVVTEEVIHWVPGAEDANVSWTVDLQGAEVLRVVLGGKLLTEYVDYTFDATSGKLEVFGVYLTDAELGLGDHEGYVFTENGSAEIEVHIVDNPTVEGTTIPLKEIQDINLSSFTTHTVTEPIANATDLFITEISTDMGNYNYIEVFNNTNEEYNLKDHRIVFADTTKQTNGVFAEKGIVELPLGAASATYIYNDYKIPALSSALIWIVNTSPWEVDSSRKVSEAAGAESLILGDKDVNLNVDDFKRVYGLDENVLVFPSRTNYMLGRTDYGINTGGWGTALAKGDSNRWKDINSSVANRMIQIQKMDETKIFEEEGTGKFYIYEMDVLNREEVVYADGKLDENDTLTANPTEAVGGTNREFVHALFARKVYVTSATDATPTGEYGIGSVANGGIDLYNCNTAPYYEMLNSGFVTPMSTALIYPNLVTDAETGAIVADKWGNTYEQFALQYAAPNGSHIARLVPIEGMTAQYQEFFKENTNKDLILSCLAAEITGYGANSTVQVPVDPAYPTDYLAKNHNTAGRVTTIMLPPAE